MAKKTYTRGYIFTPGVSGSTQVTLPDKVGPEQVLLIIHVPSKTTLYNFNDTTFNAVTFTNIQQSVTVSGNVMAGNTAIKFTSGQFNNLKYNSTGVQQGWRITGTGMPVNGNIVDYTNGVDIIYLDYPATATNNNVSLTFTDRSFSTRIGNIPVDTSSFNESDKLLIITDSEPAPLVSFRDFLIDPVGKLRVSTPQSLIDTDFEYGPQPTKWQTMSFINNMYSSYGRNTDQALTSTISTVQGNGSAIVSVTTTTPHGLADGQPVRVTGTQDEQANGDFLVSNINATTFRYVGTGTVSSGSILQNGVAIYPGAFFTGANIRFTAVKTFGNSTVQCITNSAHGLAINNTISVVNFSWSNITGAQQISSVSNIRAFEYTVSGSITTAQFSNGQGNVYVRPQGIIIANPADGGISMTTNDTQPNSRIIRQSRKYFRYQSGKGVQISFNVAFNNPAQPATGIANRAGVYDDQNGAYWEWDGTTLWAVRRSAIRQVTGTVTVTNGSGIVTGTGTNFTTEVWVGQYVVIKGNTYKVLVIDSNTSMQIAPSYRADPSITSLNGCKMSLVIDSRIPQSGFNLDVIDGTGESGFTLDINKNNMWYIDFAWYGAGAIRFGVKDQFGDILYVHKFVHGNNKVEAYFRTGNLPLRYEVENGPTPPSFAPILFHWGTSMLMDGRFDEDRGYTFSATGQLNTINQFSPYTILNIRLAPTVDNGIPSGFGVRDLTNHMQLWPTAIDVSVTDACQIQVILNGTLSNPAPVWVNVGGNSLTQYDEQATLTTGGEIVFQGIAGAPAPRQNAVNYAGQTTLGGQNFNTVTYDLNKIKELNNSILGGFNTYPDGPDSLSVVVTPLNNNVRVLARAVLRWAENQS